MTNPINQDDSIRKRLIRLAYYNPEIRPVLLPLLKQANEPRVGKTYTLKADGYVNRADGRYPDWIRAGTKAKLTEIGEDDDGAFYFFEVKHVPGVSTNNTTPFKAGYLVTEAEIHNWR
jgi:hypothetical protein